MSTKIDVYNYHWINTRLERLLCRSLGLSSRFYSPTNFSDLYQPEDDLCGPNSPLRRIEPNLSAAAALRPLEDVNTETNSICVVLKSLVQFEEKQLYTHP